MKSRDHLLHTFLRNHPTKAIGVLSQIPFPKLSKSVHSLNKVNQLLILRGLIPSLSAKVIETFSDEEITRFLMDLPFMEAESILRCMNSEIQERVLTALPNQLSDSFKEFLNYSKNQIGSYIDPHVIVLEDQYTVSDAIKRLKTIPEIKQHLLYIIDSQYFLIGYITLSKILSNEKDVKVEHIMQTIDIFVRAEMKITEVLNNWDYRFIEIPVIDNSGKFMGIVNRQSLLGKKDLNINESTAIKKAGNALAEIYFIGLTSLLGSSDS